VGHIRIRYNDEITRDVSCHLNDGSVDATPDPDPDPDPNMGVHTADMGTVGYVKGRQTGRRILLITF